MSTEPFSEALKRIRSERGLSRKSAAAVVGATERTWQRWEAGQSCPRYSQVGVLCILGDKISTPPLESRKQPDIMSKPTETKRQTFEQLKTVVRAPLFKPSGAL